VKPLLAIITLIALSGCGLAGSAARVGSERISDGQLNSEVSAVVAAQGRPTGASDPVLIRQVLERMVIIELVDQLAEQQGIVVANGDVERIEAGYAEQFGGLDQFRAAVLQQGIAPGQIAPFLRMGVQVAELRASVGEDEQAFADLVINFAEERGVEVSPRYGTWLPDALFVGPPEDALSVES